MRRLSAMNAQINVLYVTDGSASHPRSRRYPADRLRVLREREARAALRRIDIRTDPKYLRAPDGKLQRLNRRKAKKVRANIRQILLTLQPELLLLPWLEDPHPDHIATTKIFLRVLSRMKLLRSPDILMYTVWFGIREYAQPPSPLEVEVLTLTLNDEEMDSKRQAIMEHRSQVSELIADDPTGFRIDESLLHRWIASKEMFYRWRKLGTHQA